MHELYIVIDDSDNPQEVAIVKCPVLHTYNQHEGIPDQPCRVVPPLEAEVLYNDKPRRVILSIDAAVEQNVALRLAFRKLERYMFEAEICMVEAHRAFTLDPRDQRRATDYAAAAIHFSNIMESVSAAIRSLYAQTT